MSTRQLVVTINRSACSGYGICADMLPSVFKLDDQGFAYVEGPVSMELEEEAREAAYECPEEAITVEVVESE